MLGKPADTPWAEVGVLAKRGVDGERGDSGFPASFGGLTPLEPQDAGVMDLAQGNGHGCQKPHGMLAGGDQAIDFGQGLNRFAGGVPRHYGGRQ